MKKILTIYLVLLNVSFLFGQVYEDGYYINNLDEKIEGWILNEVGTINPTSFTFKSTPEGASKIVLITDVKQFGLETALFKRFEVGIDKSSVRLDNLASDKNINKETNTVFLESIVEGALSLYQYKGNGFVRYFYSSDGITAVQLDYKKYKYIQDSKTYVRYNKQFQGQLYNLIGEPILSIKDLSDLDYDYAQLKQLFRKYNKSQGSEYKVYDRKTGIITRGIAKIGYGSSSANSSDLVRSFSLEQSSGAVVEVELDFFSGSKARNLAFSLQTRFSSFRGEGVFVDRISSVGDRGDYKNVGIDLGIGAKYHLKVGEKVKIIPKAAVKIMGLRTHEIRLNSSGTRENLGKVPGGLHLHLGLSFGDKVYAEVSSASRKGSFGIGVQSFRFAQSTVTLGMILN